MNGTNGLRADVVWLSRLSAGLSSWTTPQIAVSLRWCTTRSTTWTRCSRCRITSSSSSISSSTCYTRRPDSTRPSTTVASPVQPTRPLTSDQPPRRPYKFARRPCDVTTPPGTLPGWARGGGSNVVYAPQFLYGAARCKRRRRLMFQWLFCVYFPSDKTAQQRLDRF